MRKKYQFSLYPIAITYFLDNFGLAIIFPIFTPLFLDPRFQIVDASLSTFTRSALLGIAIASFPLAQFFSSPLIGELSDRWGRKKVLTYTIFGTSIGYLITGIGILKGEIISLFLGRLWTGFFAGNLTVCLAATADISTEEKERTKNFGLLGSAGGLSFILAIFLGGTLGTYSASLPFWIMTLLAWINTAFVRKWFPESHPRHTQKKIHLLQGIHNVLGAFQTATMRRIYLIFFFYLLCWSASMQFLPSFLLKTYGIFPHTLTTIFMGIGIIWTLTNLILNPILARRVHAPKTLGFSLAGLGIFLMLIPYFHNLIISEALFYGAVLCGALSWTNALATVSLTASPETQGSVLGINRSVGSIGTIIGPTIGGLIAGINVEFIYTFTGASALGGLAVLLSLKKFLAKRHLSK